MTTVASFFTGAMGLDLGLEESGCTIVTACENDRHARATIAAARPELPIFDDIRQVTARDFSGVDVVAGGPPCQAFSTIGKRGGFSDDRGSLLVDYVRLAVQIMPRFILLENVRGLLSTRTLEGYPVMDAIVGYLRESGYECKWRLVNAADYGAPQTRQRVILVATRGRVPGTLRQTHAQHPTGDLQPWRTLRDALTDLHDPAPRYTPFSSRRAEIMRLLGPGEDWRDLPVDMQKQAMGSAYYASGGRTAFYRRLAWDRPCPTLTSAPASKATTLAHPDELRPLTVAEYLRVQGFPDGWPVQGSIASQYRQIGNAVPVPLGRAIGELLQN